MQSVWQEPFRSHSCIVAHSKLMRDPSPDVQPRGVGANIECQVGQLYAAEGSHRSSAVVYDLNAQMEKAVDHQVVPLAQPGDMFDLQGCIRDGDPIHMEKIDPGWGDADQLSSVRHQCRDRSVGRSLGIHPSTQSVVGEQCEFKDSFAGSIRELRDAAQLLSGASSLGQAQCPLGCIKSIHLTESQVQAKC